MKPCTNLLNNVYRTDNFFKKLKEIYEKWKNYNNHKDKHIVGSLRDIIFLKLKVDFTKYPNILINQLLEINFSCKECFKIYLIMYRIMLSKNNMYFKCKKEYIRKIIKVNRTTLERGLKELEEKNMIIMNKDINDNTFYFVINLCFSNWNLENRDKERVLYNNFKEIEKYHEKYIDCDDLL